MGIQAVKATIATSFKYLAQNVQPGGPYVPVSAPGTRPYLFNFGTGAANNASGGGDEVFSFQVAIPPGSSVTLDLYAMTDVMLTPGVAIARLKVVQFKLLSQADVPSVPANASGVLVTNNSVILPADLFSNGGTGLLLNVTATGTISGTSVNTSGSGYPPSQTFLVAVPQAGGRDGVIAIVTNSSGVPAGTTVLAGGTGYSSAVLPVIALGSTRINGGTATTIGGVSCYFDATPNGFALVTPTSRNVRFLNLDAVNAAAVEVDIFAATT